MTAPTHSAPSAPVLGAVRGRHSFPKVTLEAPSHEELLPLVEAAASVADYGSLRPWRLLEVRGDARKRVGDAFVEDSGIDPRAATKLAEKPLRASLLIAIVFSPQPSLKVTEWEQEVAAAGVAHMLSLLLTEAGWGVMWRSGKHTRSLAVHTAHELEPQEKLLGWLYVGGIPEKTKPEKKDRFKAEKYLREL